jgi:hypothetical protein
MRSPTLISAMRRAGILVFLLAAGANAARAQSTAAPSSAVSTPAPLITIAPSPEPHPLANDKILINGQI